jgi:hypothetical protein
MGPRKALDAISLDELDQVGGGRNGAHVGAMIPTDYIRKWNQFEICLQGGWNPSGCAAEAGLRRN